MNSMEKGYSLKQIADEIGISKMKVYRFVKANNIKERYTTAQTKYYDESVRKTILKEFIDTSTDTSADTSTDTSNGGEERPIKFDYRLFELLNKQIEQQEKELEIKNKQIGNKDKQLEKMQELLSQQQQLSLQDKKTIQKYEEENKDLHMMIDLNNNQKKDSELRKDDELPTKDKETQSIRTKKGFFSRLFR